MGKFELARLAAFTRVHLFHKTLAYSRPEMFELLGTLEPKLRSAIRKTKGPNL